jgi:tRNA(adenine34) deaminase
MDEAGRQQHEAFMHLALEQAARAREAGEVPVGAVVVLDGTVVGTGHNLSVALNDPTAHAEVLALRGAASRVGTYRLVGSTLYCTVEPCLMCLGASLHARVGRVVYGASDLRVGAVARLESLWESRAGLNHRFETIGGVLAGPAASFLLEFFRERRKDGALALSSDTASPSA